MRRWLALCLCEESCPRFWPIVQPPPAEEAQLGIEDTVAGHLPAPRLAPYLAATGSVSGAMRLYCWNLELLGTIHESLGVVEVTMRNSIDRQLQAWNRGDQLVPGPQPMARTGSSARAARSWASSTLEVAAAGRRSRRTNRRANGRSRTPTCGIPPIRVTASARTTTTSSPTSRSAP